MNTLYLLQYTKLLVLLINLYISGLCHLNWRCKAAHILLAWMDLSKTHLFLHTNTRTISSPEPKILNVWGLIHDHWSHQGLKPFTSKLNHNRTFVIIIYSHNLILTIIMSTRFKNFGLNTDDIIELYMNYNSIIIIVIVLYV